LRRAKEGDVEVALFVSGVEPRGELHEEEGKLEAASEFSAPVGDHSGECTSIEGVGTNVGLALIPQGTADRLGEEGDDHGVPQDGGLGGVYGSGVGLRGDVALGEGVGARPRLDVRASPVGANQTDGDLDGIIEVSSEEPAHRRQVAPVTITNSLRRSNRPSKFK